MVALRCTENSTPSALARAIWIARNASQRGHPHDRGVDHLTGQDRHGGAQDGDVAVVTGQLDPEGAGPGHHRRPLGGPEVAAVHVGHVGPRRRRPCSHPVRVGPGVVLDRGGGPTIRVSLAQHRVDGAAHDLVVAGPHGPLVVGLRVVGIVGKGVAVALQLGDGRFELGAGRRDVGKLDDVGLGGLGQLAQLGQSIPDPLVLLEPLGKSGDDPPGQGDVPGLHPDTGGRGVRLDDGQERVRGQGRRLVGVGVDDGRVGQRHSASGRGRARIALARLQGHHPSWVDATRTAATGAQWRNIASWVRVTLTTPGRDVPAGSPVVTAVV